MGESYFVVSDVHLGAKDCCKEEFEHFLEWLLSSYSGGKLSVQTQRGKRTLAPPTTLILLGDMLELWIPREYERSSVLCDSSSIFSKLIDLAVRRCMFSVTMMPICAITSARKTATRTTRSKRL